MSVRQQPNPVRANGPVRIRLAASVANNLDALKEGIASLVKSTGHPHCFSGLPDCSFTTARDYVIDAQAVASTDPEPNPWRTVTQNPSNTAVVKVSAEAANNIETVNAIVAKVAGLLGCPGCHSGFDVLYAQEIAVLTAGVDGNVNAA